MRFGNATSKSPEIGSRLATAEQGDVEGGGAGWPCCILVNLMVMLMLIMDMMMTVMVMMIMLMFMVVMMQRSFTSSRAMAAGSRSLLSLRKVFDNFFEIKIHQILIFVVCLFIFVYFDKDER